VAEFFAGLSRAFVGSGSNSAVDSPHLHPVAPPSVYAEASILLRASAPRVSSRSPTRRRSASPLNAAARMGGVWEPQGLAALLRTAPHSHTPALPAEAEDGAPAFAQRELKHSPQSDPDPALAHAAAQPGTRSRPNPNKEPVQLNGVRVCAYFNSKSGCRKGELCDFKHEVMGRPGLGGDSEAGKGGNKALTPSAEVFSRIKWDPALDPSHFTIVYEDRFKGMVEVPFLSFGAARLTVDEFVPWHRVFYFKRMGEVVWDRKNMWESL